MSVEQQSTDSNGSFSGTIGFLQFGETDTRDGYIGAILVTDDKGVPLEFRCTRPIKPNAFQRPLFGSSLEPHIGVRLCGSPLIDALKSKPKLVFVDKLYLTRLRESCKSPVVFVKRVGEAIDIQPGQSQSPSYSKYEPKGNQFIPIICEWHPQFAGDESEARLVLDHCSKYFDPIEAFERVSKAVAMLREKDERFR